MVESNKTKLDDNCFGPLGDLSRQISVQVDGLIDLLILHQHLVHLEFLLVFVAAAERHDESQILKKSFNHHYAVGIYQSILTFSTSNALSTTSRS